MKHSELVVNILILNSEFSERWTAVYIAVLNRRPAIELNGTVSGPWQNQEGLVVYDDIVKKLALPARGEFQPPATHAKQHGIMLHMEINNAKRHKSIYTSKVVGTKNGSVFMNSMGASTPVEILSKDSSIVRMMFRMRQDVCPVCSQPTFVGGEPGETLRSLCGCMSEITRAGAYSLEDTCVVHVPVDGITFEE